jgi:hypothetical protein
VQRFRCQRIVVKRVTLTESLDGPCRMRRAHRAEQVDQHRHEQMVVGELVHVPFAGLLSCNEFIADRPECRYRKTAVRNTMSIWLKKSATRNSAGI